MPSFSECLTNPQLLKHLPANNKIRDMKLSELSLSDLFVLLEHSFSYGLTEKKRTAIRVEIERRIISINFGDPHPLTPEAR